MINPQILVPPPVVRPPSSELAEMWTSIFPWDDISAKGIPERNLGLGTDVVPTLSVMAAAGGPNKRLIKVDASGRLLASAIPYGFDTFNGFQGVAQIVVIPNDITLYAPGMPVMFIASSAGAPNIEIRRVESVLPRARPPTFLLSSALQLAYVSGDTILILPATVLAGPLPQTRRFDWQSLSAPGDGVAAALTVPAVAGQVIVCGPVDAATVAHNVNAEAASTVQILDGVAGTEIWRQYLGVKEANGPQADRWTHPGLQLRSTAGNALVIQFTAGAANIAQTISAAGWFENAGGGTIL